MGVKELHLGLQWRSQGSPWQSAADVTDLYEQARETLGAGECLWVELRAHSGDQAVWALIQPPYGRSALSFSARDGADLGRRALPGEKRGPVRPLPVRTGRRACYLPRGRIRRLGKFFHAAT